MVSNENLLKYFSKISRFDEEKAGYMNPEEWKEERERGGVKYFKRKVLGFCGLEITKSIDELAEILCEIGMVKNITAGKKLIPKLYGKEFHYGGGNFIFLKEVENISRQKAIRIEKRVMKGFIF